MSAEGVTVRVLTISQEHHETLYNPHNLDLFELVGKNAAARRARGSYLLFTNPDNCWSDQLGQLLGRRRLKPNVFYTAIRGQVRHNVRANKGSSADSMHHYVTRHHFAHYQDSPWEVTSQMPRVACIVGEPPLADQPPTFFAANTSFADIQKWVHRNASGDFFLAPRRMVLQARGYPEVPQNLHVDGMMPFMAMSHGYGHLFMGPGCINLHQPHARSGNFRHSVPIWTLDEINVHFLQLGHLANHRPSEAREGVEGEGKREWYQWNDKNWGLGSAQLRDEVLTSECG